MRPAWPDFHDWVEQRFGRDFMERALFSGYCKLSNRLVYYPVLDQFASPGSYVLKALALAEREGIHARYGE